MIWSHQVYNEPGSILLVLASEEFNESEYIRDYSEFKAMVDAKKSPAVKFLDLRPSPDLASRLVDACSRVVTSGNYVLGPDVAAFEREWAAYCGVSHAVGVASGLDALFLMLRAADIPAGAEVIVPANTYIATILGITMAGLKPVLVEPDAETHNLDPQRVEAAITPATKAIMAVDLYGQPADAVAIRAIADAHGLLAFCDAAQSHGALCDGRRACTFYDATAYSFYPSKNLGAVGEAGAVVTGDLAIAERVRLLRNYGSRVRYENEVKGVNARIDTLQCAMLREKLPLLDKQNTARAAIAKIYLHELSSIQWLTLPVCLPHITPVWHLFVVRCEQRDKLRAHLEACGIPTLVHYPIPPHLSKAYTDLGFSGGSFPITESLASTVLSLPIGPHMTADDAHQVVRAVKAFYPIHE